MDSSSEDDYFWEKCSNSDSEAMAHEEESDFDKRYKKKLQKELFQNGDIDDSQEEPRVRKKKKIKREPGSPAMKEEPDSDSRGRPALLNGHAGADAERALERKVKQERASFAVPRDSPRERSRSAGSGDEAPARKKKKAKKERRDEPEAEDPPKKKKKKRKRETDEGDTVLDKFEAAETVVEKRRSGTGGTKIEHDKPFTSKEFVEDDSDSSEERPAEPPHFASGGEKSRVASGGQKPRVASGGDKPPSPEPAPGRPSKTRERITYEEESQDRPSPSPGVSPGPAPAPAGRLARFLRSRPHLAPAPAPAAAAVSRDDDVWLVRCPRGLGAAALAGAALPLGARGRLKAGGRAYEAAPAPCGARAALLLGGARWAVRGVRVRGALQLRERVPRVRAPPAAPPAAEPPVPLPATKPRHPLLGVDYERAPAPPPRPRAAPEPDGTEPDGTEPDGTEPAGTEPAGPERREKKKKKKKEKRKREREEEAPARSPSPLPRKKRRSAPAADVWDSERAIEESLFNF